MYRASLLFDKIETAFAHKSKFPGEDFKQKKSAQGFRK